VWATEETFISNTISTAYLIFIGNQALYYACLCGHPKIVRFLLQNGSNFNRKTTEGNRYYLASLTDEIRTLLKTGGGPNVRELFAAVGRGDLTQLKKDISFLALASKPSAKDASSKDEIKASSKIDFMQFVDESGKTLLQKASELGHEDIVVYLLEQGHSRTLFSDLGFLRTKKFFADIVFKLAENQTMNAHKAILEVRAPNLLKEVLQQVQSDKLPDVRTSMKCHLIRS
jgi:ankyrin repeat protein